MGERNSVLALCVMVAALGTALPAAAQTAWDSPLLVPPRPAAGAGIYLIAPHRRDVGVLGSWRLAGSPSVGLRVGFADGAGPRDDRGLSALAGVDFSGPLTRASYEFPLDVSWVFGGGVAAGPGLRISFPAGLIVGHTFAADNVRFTPYGSPRIIMDGTSRSEGFGGDDRNLRLHFAMDIGMDIAFQPNWLIRFGMTFGDRSALAVGVEF